MVEIKGRRRTGPRNVDWVAVYERWSAGERAGLIADEFGLQPDTVQQRCKWLDQNFPREARSRRAHGFSQALEEAHASLLSGDPAEAERRAKAVFALVRAARAIEDWAGEAPDRDTQGQSGRGGSGEEGAGEKSEARAELERRLARLKDARGRRGAGSKPQPGSLGDAVDPEPLVHLGRPPSTPS
ncbi:MAG: hypothetical protein ABL308_00105 [Oceanicaulis sp.]